MRIITVLLSMSLLAGCAAKKGPGYDILSTTPASGSVSADQIHALRDGTWTYRITQGDDEGETIVYARAGATEYGAAWAQQQGNRRVEYWSRDAEGNIVMPAVVEHADRAISLFDPPLILAYRELAAGQARAQQVSMRIMDERNPARQRDAGTATQTIEYLDDQRLKTPLGVLETRRLQVTFTADLKMANAETITTLWIAPDLGVVVRQRRDTVSMMGIPIRSGSETLVLVNGDHRPPG